MRRAFVLVVALGAVVASICTRASAAPTPFSLTFEGAHVVDSGLPAGVRHDGRFMASAPFCSAGRAYDVRDVELEPLTVMRIHTCDDGSGSFTAFMPSVIGEHGGGGTWKIVEGTGRYATLRGLGTYSGMLVSGNPSDFTSIVYRTTWQGVVDFDAVAPAIDRFAVSARKLRRPARTYTVTIALTARDTAIPISFTVDVRSGRSALAFKQGSTASGQARLAVRLHAPSNARSVRITLTATDAVGNATSRSRVARLPK